MEKVEEKYDFNVTELSDVEFLSYLYAERDREEKQSRFQGWNIWAIAGAMITVACAGYKMLTRNNEEIDWVKTGFLLSFAISFLIFCRPLTAVFFWTKKKSIDIQKIRYLKDLAPNLYLNIAIVCSIGLAVFFLIVEYGKHWTLLPYLWILMSILYIVARVNVVVNKDKIVRSYIDEAIYVRERNDIWFGGAVGGVSGMIITNSFLHITLPVIGTSEFELSVCVSIFIILVYILFTIINSVKSWARIDVLLDDYIYKNRTKESIFKQISNHKMGSSILEACSQELYEIKNAFDDFEPHMKKIEELAKLLSNEDYDGKNLHEHYNLIKASNNYLGDCNNRLQDLGKKMTEIAYQAPLFGITEEYKGMMTILNVLLARENEFKELVKDSVLKMQDWLEKYHCEKYCSWCLRKDCNERNDRMLLRYRLRLWVMRIFPKTVKCFSVWREDC